MVYTYVGKGEGGGGSNGDITSKPLTFSNRSGPVENVHLQISKQFVTASADAGNSFFCVSLFFPTNI